jgi:hypothetical protein
VLVRHVQLHRLRARGFERHRMRPDERRIVELHDVIRPARQQLANLAPLEPRSPRLLRRERGQPPPTAAQFVAVHARVLGKGLRRRGGVQEVIRVHAVHHVYMMAGVPERVRQAVDVHRVAAEAVRRVEGREVQEVQRPSGVPRTAHAGVSRCSQGHAADPE